jgi:LysM repeat protein
MSQMDTGPGPEPTGNPLTTKHMGIPGWGWMIGAAVVAYLLFFRNKSGASGTGTSASGNTSTTGNISIGPSRETIITGSDQTATSTASSSSTSAVSQPSQSGTPNPQPTPSPPTKTSTTTTKVTTPAKPSTTVTVAKWPGQSSGGLAQWNTTLWGIANHYGTTVAELLKLNPSIKNANLIYPGQKIKVP